MSFWNIFNFGSKTPEGETKPPVNKKKDTKSIESAAKVVGNIASNGKTSEIKSAEKPVVEKPSPSPVVEKSEPVVEKSEPEVEKPAEGNKEKPEEVKNETPWYKTIFGISGGKKRKSKRKSSKNKKKKKGTRKKKRSSSKNKK